MPKRSARKARAASKPKAKATGLSIGPVHIKTGLVVLGLILLLTPLAIWGVVVLAGVVLHHFGFKAIKN